MHTAASVKPTRRNRYPPRQDNRPVTRCNFDSVPQLCGLVLGMQGPKAAGFSNGFLTRHLEPSGVPDGTPFRAAAGPESYGLTLRERARQPD